MSKPFMVGAWRQTHTTNSHAYIYYMFDVALESLEWQRPQEDALQRLIRGRELDLLWSGEPNLRTEELRSFLQVAPLAAWSKFCHNGSIHLTHNRDCKESLLSSSLYIIYTVYWQTKFSLFDSSVFQRQESRMNFISCLKSVSMRIEVGTLPWLMTEDRDIPILRIAMVYTAHEEPLLRTQARNAMLTLFSKIKIGDGQLLRTALEMAKSRKLGWVIGKSWQWTWHVMPLYWTRWLGKASCWRIYALSRLSHLSFWSICFLTGDGTLLPHKFHTSLVETSMMSLSTFSCILDFPGCRPLCALYFGRIGQTWHKQPKTGMRRLCKNGHFVKRTVFLIPHKGVRDGGRYGTTTFWKAKSKAFARAGCAVLYPQIYVYQNGVNICNWLA